MMLKLLLGPALLSLLSIPLTSVRAETHTATALTPASE